MINTWEKSCNLHVSQVLAIPHDFDVRSLAASIKELIRGVDRVCMCACIVGYKHTDCYDTRHQLLPLIETYTTVNTVENEDVSWV